MVEHEGSRAANATQPSKTKSPSMPLAPLEYLQQNQRRGSITDPSLHHTPAPSLNFFRQPSDSSAGPSSSYVFGDATATANENPALRKILRSPSIETESPEARPAKRKMSSDRVLELSGPGVSGNEQAPPPKRRGSAIDTFSSLSLNEQRRNSVPNWRYSGPSGAGMAFAWPPPPQQETSNMQHNADPMHMMPPINFNPDRRMSVPNALSSSSSSSSPPATRALRSRSRPPSRQAQSVPPVTQEEVEGSADQEALSSKGDSRSPYSRSPELRVSHKLAERKRRKEMKDLFDELRDQLPADRGMKASKWEILSKAIDFVNQLKQSHQDMAREIDMLRHELDAVRQNSGLPPFAGVVYGQGPMAAPYPLPPGVLHPQHISSPQPQPSRPASSQNMFPPNQAPQNGNIPES